jgi:hypothetical protein
VELDDILSKLHRRLKNSELCFPTFFAQWQVQNNTNNTVQQQVQSVTARTRDQPQIRETFSVSQHQFFLKQDHQEKYGKIIFIP